MYLYRLVVGHYLGRVWLLVAVLRGSLSVVIAALRGRCISCILCKVERTHWYLVQDNL